MRKLEGDPSPNRDEILAKVVTMKSFPFALAVLIGAASASLPDSVHAAPPKSSASTQKAQEDVKKANEAVQQDMKQLAEGQKLLQQAQNNIKAANKNLAAAKEKAEAAKRTPEQKAAVDASIAGDRKTLVADSAIPATMAVIYLLLLMYFKSIGGYKAVKIETAEPPKV